MTHDLFKFIDPMNVCDPWSSSETVSYTHLDVYKRQSCKRLIAKLVVLVNYEAQFSFFSFNKVILVLSTSEYSF